MTDEGVSIRMQPGGQVSPAVDKPSLPDQLGLSLVPRSTPARGLVDTRLAPPRLFTFDADRRAPQPQEMLAVDPDPGVWPRPGSTANRMVAGRSKTHGSGWGTEFTDPSL
jgi:hypothetical protein